MQQGPTTIASAASIAPVNFLTRITGTTPVTTITPPVSGVHMLAFVWSTGTVSGFGTGGNIAVAKTTVTDVMVFAVYDPRTQLYYFN